MALCGGLAAWQFMRSGQDTGQKAAVTQSSVMPVTDTKQLATQYTLQLIATAKQLQSQPQNAATLSKTLETISKQRETAMQSLLKRDPAAFLSVAEPTGFKDTLPATAAEHTEKAVDVTGKLEVWHGEKIGADSTNDHDHEEMTAVYEYYLQDNTGKSRIYFNKDIDPSFYGKNVKLKGVQLSSNIAAHVDDLQLAPGETKQSVLGASTEKKVAVILFNFTANTAKPWTADQVRSAVFSATNSTDSYYRQASFNALGLSGITNTEGDVFGWYTISSSNTTCIPDTWAAAAKTAAQNAGVNLSGYTNFVFAFPYDSACNWGGIGVMPGSNVWINGYATDPSLVAHELGHNFGSHHSSSLNCTSSTGARVTMSDTCALDEYGDPFDVMGSGGLKHFNNFQKGRLGFYASTSNTVTAPVGTSTYKVLPIETSTTGLQSLRVPRTLNTAGTPTDYYYIESRKTSGFDNFAAGSPVVSGASIRIGYDYSVVNRPELLDMTPATTTFTDSSLAIGKTFTDSKRGITITTTAADSTGVTVTVTRPSPPCVRANPSVTIAPTSQWTDAGKALSYSVSITNQDSTSCASSSFSLAGSLPAGFTQTPASTSVSLAPGASSSVTVQVTSSTTTTSGTYSFTELVTNTAATTYKASVLGAFNVYATAPVVAITQPANGTKIGTKVLISATASSQAGVSKIEMYVNGIVVKTVTGVTNIDYNLNTHKQTSAAYNVAVRAYDTQGHTGSSSITLYK